VDTNCEPVFAHYQIVKTGTNAWTEHYTLQCARYVTLAAIHLLFFNSGISKYTVCFICVFLSR